MANPEGFTPELERICAEACAEFGDPPCWRLPELVETCEHVTPCEECLSKSRPDIFAQSLCAALRQEGYLVPFPVMMKALANTQKKER